MPFRILKPIFPSAIFALALPLSTLAHEAGEIPGVEDTTED